MINIYNKTPISNNIVNDIFLNIFSRIDDQININIYYIDKDECIKENAINIIYDKELYDHASFKIMEFNDFFIKNNKEAVIRKNNAIIFNFDIIGFIYFIINNDLYFIDRRWFNIPFVENTINWFLYIIKSGNINYNTNNNKKQIYVLPTFDIDRINFFFFQKTLLYHIYKILHINKNKVNTYFNAKQKYKKDPWNNVSIIQQLLDKKHLKGIFFVMAKNRDQFARRYTKKQLMTIIKSIKHNIGIHLSYESGIDKQKINKEIKEVSSLHNNIKFSRFHYLYTPSIEHYNIMYKHGIKVDFSIGFTKHNGFKKGFCDIYKIPGIDIYEIPTIAMDSAVYKEVLLNGKDCLDSIIDNMNKTGGLFTFIFHQSAYSEITFPGFKSILYRFFDLIEKYNMKGIDIEQYIDAFEKKTKELNIKINNTYE